MIFGKQPATDRTAVYVSFCYITSQTVHSL